LTLLPTSKLLHLRRRPLAVRLAAAVAPPEALQYGLTLSGEAALAFPPGVGVFSHADWVAAWQTAPEVDYTTTEIEGSLPAELLGGALYRAGPGRFDRGGERYEHVLDGDGYVLKFSFPSAAGSGVQVRGRFVETAWFQEEEAANALKFRNTFGKQRRVVTKGLDAPTNRRKLAYFLQARCRHLC
jgi:hypothetical protein